MSARLLDSVHAGLLDCMQANLAVLADHHHGAEAHLNLGATLRFRWRGGQGELPTVEPPPLEQITEAEHTLGLAVHKYATVTGAELVDSVRPGSLAYVVADAYELPWVPYFRNEHLKHSFLLTADCTVLDAYANETRWGSAVPGCWELSPEELAVSRAEVFHLEPAGWDLPALPARVERIDADDYLAAYDAFPDRTRAMERLTLETWLLARSRRLHARFLEHRGIRPDAEQAAHLDRWDSLVEQAYLAFRRVSRGRAEPAGVVRRLGEVLAADPLVFDTPATPDREEHVAEDRIRRSVAAVVGSVLEVTESRLLDGAEFTKLPQYSSFRLVEIVERLETELEVDIDPADLVPENLHHVDDLCRIVHVAPRGVPVTAKGI